MSLILGMGQMRLGGAVTLLGSGDPKTHRLSLRVLPSSCSSCLGPSQHLQQPLFCFSGTCPVFPNRLLTPPFLLSAEPPALLDIFMKATNGRNGPSSSDYITAYKGFM